MMESQGTPLTHSLAVQAQIRLPGTVGRLLKQIRDIERIAPLFAKAGLVRPVDIVRPLTTRVAGIATKSVTTRALGGFLYAVAAVRMDIAVTDNAIATIGQDSACEIDDIGFEDRDKQLALMSIRLAYQLTEMAVQSPAAPRLILLDCPLLLNRSMVPFRETAARSGLQRTYDDTVTAIERFWQTYRERLFPWNPEGPVIAALSDERFGAIIQIAQQDLRTQEGRSQVLRDEQINPDITRSLTDSAEIVSGIGAQRFLNGILWHHTRTAAFRMNITTPRMEPSSIAALGTVGFHYRVDESSFPQLLQLIGDEPLWTKAHIDHVASLVASLTLGGRNQALPIPLLLATRENQALRPYLDFYRTGIRHEMKRRDIEDIWLSDLHDLAGMEEHV